MNDITDNDKLMAAICYPISFIVSAVILLSESMKVRPFQKFHAVQAIAFDVVLWVIVVILAPFTCGLSFFLWLATFWPAYKAYKGEYVEIPVITDFIRKQGWVA